jgi:SAM-dependent methyltransferase
MSVFKTTINSEALNWLVHSIQVDHIRGAMKYCRGTLLDVGCGKKPYREILERHISQYVGVEHPATLHGLTDVEVVADALTMPFRDRSFDTVVSFQVMEHIPEPQLFMREIFRLLKPGGHAILTTPFMWGEHEAPYDFYRYTRYGLKYLAEKAGFETIAIEPQSKFWTMAALRLNYYISRFFPGALRFIPYPLYVLDQLAALALDTLPHSYTVDSIGFTTVVKKP